MKPSNTLPRVRAPVAKARSRERPFGAATDAEIRRGDTSDIYFPRTLQILRKAGKDRTHVVMEVTTSDLPAGYPWAVLSGVHELVALLDGRNVDLWALPPGTIFTARTPRGIPTPVAYLEGAYGDFCNYETPALGLLCEASGISTKAARVRKAAGDHEVISFGVRRMHPALAPFIERHVFMGGLDEVTTPLGAGLLGRKPVGTMPHALTIVMGGPREAFEALAKHLERGVPRVALVDTYYDEKTESILAAQVIPDLAGVRLDTPASRRGNLAQIVREVRWELDHRGHKDAKIYASGSIDEAVIPDLIAAGVDGFGVGTKLSNAPTVDFAMDIVEREGQPSAKRGKFSGRKSLMRCGNCGTLEVGVEVCPKCGNPVKPAMVQWLKAGKAVRKLPSAKDVRPFVIEQLKNHEL